MVVVYTDYYTYLRRMGYAGRFGTGVIYTYIDLVHRAAPWHYICRVAGCPSNRRVMSDFPKKFKDILNHKKTVFRKSIRSNSILLIYVFIQIRPFCHLKLNKDFLNSYFLKLIRKPNKVTNWA